MNVVRHGASEDAAVLGDFYARGLGGINFRGDMPIERVCRTLGIAARHARWLVGPARRWAASRLRGVGTSPARVVWDTVRGRVQVDGFSIVSHHFMSRDEVCSAIGRERLAACAFKVPVNGRMVSMCEVNASGVRASFYAEQAHARPGAPAPPALPQRGSP